MITIDIEKQSVLLTPDEQSLSMAASARKALEKEFFKRIKSKRLKYVTLGSMDFDEAVIKRMISKYSEQMIYQPLKEILFWFAYSSGAYLEPGYPPLFYSRAAYKNLSPNKSAVAGIGEGVAGLLAQRLYACRKLSRPNHDYPDIVMESKGKTYLIEAKATLASSDESIKNILFCELPRMATYISACAGLDSRPIIALLIGTCIVNESKYKCSVMEITV